MSPHARWAASLLFGSTVITAVLLAWLPILRTHAHRTGPAAEPHSDSRLQLTDSLQLIVHQAFGADPAALEGHDDPDSLSEYIAHITAVSSSTLQKISLAAYVEQSMRAPEPAILPNGSHDCLLVISVIVNASSQPVLQLIGPGDACRLLTVEQLRSQGIDEAWVAKYSKPTSTRFRVGECLAECDKLWHNFGVVASGSRLDAQFAVANVGATPLRIGQATASCGCISVVAQSDVVIPPRESHLVAVSLDAGVASSFAHTIGMTLYEPETSQARPIRMLLCGNTIESMQVHPDAIDFGVLDGFRHAAASRRIRLTEVESDRFSITSITKSACLPITSSVETRDLQGGLHEHIVTLTCDPMGMRSGRHQGHVRIDTTSAARQYITVPVVMSVLGPIELVPSQAAFGVIAAGESVRQTVAIRSRVGQDLTARVQSAPDWCDCVISTGPSGVLLSLTATSRSVGVHHDRIVIDARAGTVEETVVIDCSALVMSGAGSTSGQTLLTE